MIDLAGVNKAYQGKSVVDNINLTIQEQQLTAFIGPNGAGKSTLLSWLAV